MDGMLVPNEDKEVRLHLGGKHMLSASVMEVLYWIAIVSMAVVLVLINAGIFAISIRFLKQRKLPLGIGAFLFSLFCFYLISLMFKQTFL